MKRTRFFAALLLTAGLLAGCSSRAKNAPVAGPKAPVPKVAADEPAPGTAPLREVLVGEMCPQAAMSRPAVIPLVARRVSWTADLDEVSRPVERGAARQFSVLAWDGRRAGLFSVIGATDVGADVDVAAGSYAGASPCSELKSGADSGAAAEDNPDCVASQQGCGLAISVLQPPGRESVPVDEQPDPAQLSIGGACVAEGKLVVDLDGDGLFEAFATDRFVEALRAPADEVIAEQLLKAPCEPRFAVRHVIPPGDPRDWRGLDLLGVLDLDGDGRHEIVLAYHYADRRTWAVYSARATSTRLELVGEAVPWRR
jgi:hypothetical protein